MRKIVTPIPKFFPVCRIWVFLNIRLVSTLYPKFFPVNMIFLKEQSLGYNKICMGFNPRGCTGSTVSSPTVGAGKVKLDIISLFMPHVLPSDKEKLQLYKIIESKATVPVAYRARQCDTITVPQSTAFSWRLSVKT